MGNPIDISIVIVNYRVKYFLEQTIRSAKEALRNLRGEIIVVDNNSGDGSVEYLKERFPDVIFIENSENVGFGNANNQGFAIASGTYTLILNPDTIIGRDTIADCLRFYEAHPECGGIGVCMHDGNGRFLPESKRSFPTPWVSFCKIFGLSKIFPYSKFFAKYHLRYLPVDETHNIDILSGAFTFVKTDLLRKIDGFDKDFFMYGEDIDLSFRLVKAGFKNYYIPTPIIHYKGESTQKNSYRYVHVFYEAMIIFFRKHYPHYSLIYGFFIKFAINLRASMSLAKRFVKNIFPHKKPSAIASLHYDNLIVISPNPKEITPHVDINAASRIEWTDIKDALMPKGINFVVIDNRACDYQDIIRFICKNANSGTFFATYLSEANRVIYPKMN